MLDRRKKLIRFIVLAVAGVAAIIFMITHIKFQSKETHDNSNQSAATTSTSASTALTAAPSTWTDAETQTEMLTEESAAVLQTSQMETGEPESGEGLTTTHAEPETTTQMQTEIPTEIQTEPQTEKVMYVTIQVRCDAAVAIKNDISNEGIKELIPDDGTILSAVKVSFDEGTNVYDILAKVLGERGIPMVSNASHSYISSINQLSEKMLGMSSGWTYTVNGEMPMKPAINCVVSDGDIISFEYVCG